MFDRRNQPKTVKSLKDKQEEVNMDRMPYRSKLIVMKSNFRGTVKGLLKLLNLESVESYIKVAIRDVIRGKNDFVILNPGDAIYLILPF